MTDFLPKRCSNTDLAVDLFLLSLGAVGAGLLFGIPAVLVFLWFELRLKREVLKTISMIGNRK